MTQRHTRGRGAVSPHVISKTREELEKRREILHERLREAAVGEPLDSDAEWSTRAELSEIAFLLDGE
jgi:hypothetical protein